MANAKHLGSVCMCRCVWEHTTWFRPRSVKACTTTVPCVYSCVVFPITPLSASASVREGRWPGVIEWYCSDVSEQVFVILLWKPGGSGCLLGKVLCSRPFSCWTHHYLAAKSCFCLVSNERCSLPGPVLLKVLNWDFPVADGCNSRHFHLVSAKCPWLLHLLSPKWYPLTLPHSGEEVSILYMNLEEKVTKSEIISRIQSSHRQIPALPKWFPTWFSHKSF